MRFGMWPEKPYMAIPVPLVDSKTVRLVADEGESTRQRWPSFCVYVLSLGRMYLGLAMISMRRGGAAPDMLDHALNRKQPGPSRPDVLKLLIVVGEILMFQPNQTA